MVVANEQLIAGFVAARIVQRVWRAKLPPA
jgi:hypothetical protein